MASNIKYMLSVQIMENIFKCFKITVGMQSMQWLTAFAISHHLFHY